MKKLIVLLIVLLMCSQAVAFDWFKGYRELSMSYGDSTLPINLGICPINEEGHQHVSFGLTLTGIASHEELDDTTKIDDWLVGGYFELPILKTEELPTSPIPLDAEVFIGLRVQKYIEGNSRFYPSIYTGFETAIHKNINFRTEIQYTEQDEVLPNVALGLGLAIRHW